MLFLDIKLESHVGYSRGKNAKVNLGGIRMGIDSKGLRLNGGRNIMLDWTKFLDMGAFTDILNLMD